MSEYKFQPVDLNEYNVHQLFNYCIAKPGEKDIKKAILFSHILGYSFEDEKVLSFNKSKIVEYRPTIVYMMGQLYTVHKRIFEQPLVYYNQKYTKKPWTMNKGILMEFLYLANAASVLSPANAQKDNEIFYPAAIQPTLSPVDPNFPTWWKEHESEVYKVPKVD